MTASINQCLDQLKSDFDASIVPGSADKVYDYRTFPGKLRVTVSLSFQGQDPRESGTAGGDFNFYDITAAIGAQVDQENPDQEAALRDADRALNALETAIYGLLKKGGVSHKNNLWMTVSFPGNSIRPPNFPEVPKTRYGEIPFRLHLR